MLSVPCAGAGGPGLAPRRPAASDTMQGMEEELTAYLAALERDACYRVDRVLKSDGATATELVFFVGANGSERGPYLRKRFAADAGLGRAYQRIWEAQRAGRRFAYLPRIEECYTTGDELVVVSEYVQGETLAEVVYRCDPSVALAADVFPRLCDAVSELHGAFDPPIIHRDLKPSNVILSQNALTLIDFGIARTYDAGADSDTHRFGTRAYAPSEQFGFGQTDVRSDVYALGMLLYYLLTERTPDAAARRQGWRAAGVPEPLRRVVERAAAFDPADRYASAGELKASFLRGLGELGRAPSASPLAGDGAARPGRADCGAGSGDAVSRGASAVDASCGGASALLVSQVAIAAGAEQRMTAPPGASGSPGALIVPGDPSVTLESVSSAQAPRANGSPQPSAWGRRLGLAWDICLGSFLVLMLVGAIVSTLDPGPTAQLRDAPVAVRGLYNLVMYALFVAPACFVMCDPRPLARRFKLLARVPRSRQILVAVGIVAVGLVAYSALAAAFPEYVPASSVGQPS